MGYSGKLKERLVAQDLRRNGCSYSEIQRTVNVSKDTLSRWCKDICLTDSQKRRLVKLKHDGQKIGSIVASDNKRVKRLEQIATIHTYSRNELGERSSRDLFVAGIALYAAEGDKLDGKGGFSNANHNIIKFMVDWFRRYAEVPEDRLCGALYIHSNQDIQKALLYWSNLTGIPLGQFHRTQVIANKENSFRKTVYSHGVFSIRFSCSDVQYPFL